MRILLFLRSYATIKKREEKKNMLRVGFRRYIFDVALWNKAIEWSLVPRPVPVSQSCFVNHFSLPRVGPTTLLNVNRSSEVFLGTWMSESWCVCAPGGARAQREGPDHLRPLGHVAPGDILWVLPS